MIKEIWAKILLPGVKDLPKISKSNEALDTCSKSKMLLEKCLQSTLNTKYSFPGHLWTSFPFQHVQNDCERVIKKKDSDVGACLHRSSLFGIGS